MKQSSRGFTLIELVIVIAIIGITTGYIGPRIYGGLFTSNMDRAVRDITTLIRYARSSAITTHKVYLVRFDFDESIIGIYPKPESTGVVPELTKKVKMPQGVRLREVKTPYQGSKKEGRLEIRVTSEGFVEQGVIYIEGARNTIYTLEIKSFSGGLKVQDHYVEKVYG